MDGSLEKEMATHSSILAWKIPWTEEPDGLQINGAAKSQTRLSAWVHVDGSSTALCLMLCQPLKNTYLVLET